MKKRKYNRDVPVALRDELKRRAQVNKRSLNADGVTRQGEVLQAGTRLSEKEIIRRLDACPKNFPSLTLAEVRAAIREGRKGWEPPTQEDKQ